MHEISNNVSRPASIPATAFAATPDRNTISVSPTISTSPTVSTSPVSPVSSITTTTATTTFTATPNHPYEFECLRCPKKWNRRDPLSTHRPECCPRCKSPSWDKPKQRRARILAPALTQFADDDWARMAGSIIDTVHLTSEDCVNVYVVTQLKRYFGGNLSTC